MSAVDVEKAILGNQTTVCPHCDRGGLKIIELECRGLSGVFGCGGRWKRIVVGK